MTMNEEDSGFVLRRPDGRHRTVSGYRAQAVPEDAKVYQPDDRLRALPPSVDLRPMLTEVEDQASTNSCTANAAAGAFEYLMKRHRGDDAYDVSRLFIYFNARRIDAEEAEDEGATLTNVIEGLKQHGACSEDSWPFDADLVTESPPDEVYEEARHFVVQDCELVPTNLEAWKMALASGYPIIFGMTLFGSFDRHKKPGMVPMPSATETGRDSHGEHAMLCVGYSDVDEVFIVRNSWGSSWGDAGYCYVPYRYLMNPRYNDGDSWIIKGVEDAPLDESTWGGEESILPDVDTMLAQMDDDAYSAMLEAMGDIPFEQRLALLFLRAAIADGELGEEEIIASAMFLAPVLEKVGSPYDAADVLRNTLDLVTDSQLVLDSVDLFAQHFPTEGLASIATQLRLVVAADGESEEENEIVDGIIERWQLQVSEPEE